jgi:hypothetical protein
MPDRPALTGNLSATTMVLEKFGPGASTKDACVLQVEHAEEGPEGASWADLRTAWRAVFDVLAKDAAIAEVAGAQLALGLLEGLGPSTLPVVFLKQFRDVGDSTAACYQALVEARTQITTFRSGGRLPGKFNLIVKNFDSHPVATDLGIEGESVPVDFPFFVDVDFVMGLGTELWRAP